MKEKTDIRGRTLATLLAGIAPDVAIDLGTVNTLIAVRARGVVLREPSAIATPARGEMKVCAAGREALRLFNRMPGELRLLYPVRDGVVADRALCEAMLRFYLRKALGRQALGARLMLCLPLCVTGVERRALQEAARAAGAREVELMEEPLAAAIGAHLPVAEAAGSMIVDIGGGTTDVAVVSLGGVAASRSLRMGGTHLDAAIMDYVDKAYGVMIGSRTAENVKCGVGSVLQDDCADTVVRGRSRESGLPVTLRLGAGEVGHAILPAVQDILAAVVQTLGETPPELAGDLAARGATLCGGGAQLRGLAPWFERELGLPVQVAADPMTCVVRGALRALQGTGQPVPAEELGTVTLDPTAF